MLYGTNVPLSNSGKERRRFLIWERDLVESGAVRFDEFGIEIPEPSRATPYNNAFSHLLNQRANAMCNITDGIVSCLLHPLRYLAKCFFEH